MEAGLSGSSRSLADLRAELQDAKHVGCTDHALLRVQRGHEGSGTAGSRTASEMGLTRTSEGDTCGEDTECG